MYGIFEIGGNARKSRSFNGDTFASFDDVRTKLGKLIVVFEVDDANDAADFFTSAGSCYIVERL